MPARDGFQKSIKSSRDWIDNWLHNRPENLITNKERNSQLNNLYNVNSYFDDRNDYNNYLAEHKKNVYNKVVSETADSIFPKDGNIIDRLLRLYTDKRGLTKKFVESTTDSLVEKDKADTSKLLNSVGGMYNKSTRSIFVDPYHNSMTHEQTHALIPERQVNDISNIIEVKDKYLDEPNEVYSRLMNFRRINKLDPSKTYNIEDVKNMRTNSQDNFIFNRYTDDQILKLLNDVAEVKVNNDRMIPMGKSGIHIKKENKGKFTEYCGGKVTSECIKKGKNSSDPKIRKRATFAANARKWKHYYGGIIKSLYGNGIEKYQKGNKVRPIIDSLNPKNWGVHNYENDNFEEAFASARQDNQNEFMWNKKRYSTELSGKLSGATDGMIDHSVGKDSSWINGMNEKLQFLNDRSNVAYEIYDRATNNHNLSHKQAIAVIANALMESELDPLRIQNNGKAKGLFQFDPEGDLKRYIEEYGDDWSVGSQVDFVLRKFKSEDAMKEMPIEMIYSALTKGIYDKNSGDKAYASKGLGFKDIQKVTQEHINKNDTTGAWNNLQNIRFSKDNLEKSYSVPKIWGLTRKDVHSKWNNPDSDVYTLVRTFSQGYERPGKPHYDKRYEFVRHIDKLLSSRQK